MKHIFCRENARARFGPVERALLCCLCRVLFMCLCVCVLWVGCHALRPRRRCQIVWSRSRNPRISNVPASVVNKWSVGLVGFYGACIWNSVHGGGPNIHPYKYTHKLVPMVRLPSGTVVILYSEIWYLNKWNDKSVSELIICTLCIVKWIYFLIKLTIHCVVTLCGNLPFRFLCACLFICSYYAGWMGPIGIGRFHLPLTVEVVGLSNFCAGGTC